jgi:acetaldehyde dehydrogenase (acetylating)
MSTELDLDLGPSRRPATLAVAAARRSVPSCHGDQATVDRICEAMARRPSTHAARLGQLAHEETGYGVADHKRLKNEFASRDVWASIRDVPTVGVLRRDEERGRSRSAGRSASSRR